MIDFSYATARARYAAGEHPRLLIDADEVAALRRQCNEPPYADLMAALRQRIHLLLDEAAGSDDTAAMLAGDGSHNSLAARLGYAVNDIAMVACLDRDDDAVALLRRIMGYVCANPSAPSRVAVAGLALTFDLLHDQLSGAERSAFTAAGVDAIRRQIGPAEQYYKCAGGNITLGRTLSALPLYLAIRREPGVPDLAGEIDELLLRYEATLHVAINRDGYPEEDVGGYGSDVAAWLIWLAVYLRRAGVFDAFREAPHIRKFGAASLQFIEPWGRDLANVGDHGDDFGHREMLAVLAAETADPALLWLLGTLHYHHGKVHPENTLPDFWVEVPFGDDLQLPASAAGLLVADSLAGARHPQETGTPTAFCDRTRGLVSLRDRWHADGSLLIVDGSQRSAAAQGHAHASCGHFLLSALGEYFAIGPGRYGNEQSDQSVVLVDGQSGRSTDGQWTAAKHAGVLTGFTPGPFVDTVAVDSSHQHNCQWARRTVGFVKGDDVPGYVWIVDDLNKADDWAEYWWQLQSCPENEITLGADHATVRGWRHGNLLDVHVALPAADEYPRPHSIEWATDEAESSSHAYLTKDPSNVSSGAVSGPRAHVQRYARPADMVHGPSYVRPRLLAKVAGYNGRFMTVLLPRPAQATAATVQRLACLPASLAVRIEHGDFTDHILFAHEHCLLEADDIVARARWCVVRRRAADGVVVHAAAAAASRLEVAGQRVDV
jgi:hypothetical protein